MGERVFEAVRVGESGLNEENGQEENAGFSDHGEDKCKRAGNLTWIFLGASAGKDPRIVRIGHRQECLCHRDQVN